MVIWLYVGSVQYVVSLLLFSNYSIYAFEYFLYFSFFMFVFYFVYFCIVLCIISPFVYIAVHLPFLHKFTDHCHELKTQLQ